jgi:hypothetical protein
MRAVWSAFGRYVLSARVWSTLNLEPRQSNLQNSCDVLAKASTPGLICCMEDSKCRNRYSSSSEPLLTFSLPPWSGKQHSSACICTGMHPGIDLAYNNLHLNHNRCTYKSCRQHHKHCHSIRLGTSSKRTQSHAAHATRKPLLRRPGCFLLAAGASTFRHTTPRTHVQHMPQESHCLGGLAAFCWLLLVPAHHVTLHQGHTCKTCNCMLLQQGMYSYCLGGLAAFY